MKARLFLIGFTSLVLLACDSGVEEASCLDECSADARSDCFGSSSTGGIEPCFWEFKKCEDADLFCRDYCDHCEENGGCPKGKEFCNNKCNVLISACASLLMFRACYKEEQTEYTNQCVIPLIDCVAECADPETK